MARSILVPLDGSERAAAVLAPAVRLLDEGGRITLLRVVEEGPGATQGVAERARVSLAERCERLRAEGVAAEVVLRDGDAAGEILACAAALGPDLIAMSTHGHSGLARAVRGSVAERVLRHAEQPLLLCSPAALEAAPASPRFARILVPLDGSERSAAVLPVVLPLARAFGGAITLLRVEPFVPAAIPSPLLSSPGWDPAHTAATLEPFRERVAAAGVPVEVEATMGIEVSEILDAAEEADLVAMSTHGRSGLSRWWFGSVAEQVLRHCKRPVLVVRAAA